jgi:hypothetical protein
MNPAVTTPMPSGPVPTGVGPGGVPRFIRPAGGGRRA